MKRLLVVFVMLVTMTNWVRATDNLVAPSWRRTYSGTNVGYINIPNGNIPVVELVVPAEKYPNGVIPIRAKVKYLCTAWSHCHWLDLSVRTSFVIYDDGNEQNALARSPKGARAVAHAQSREMVAEDGRAMLFVDEATFQLDRYLPPGKYQVYAFVDLVGSAVQLSEVLPKGSLWWEPSNNKDGSAILTKEGKIDRRYSTAASVEFVGLENKEVVSFTPSLKIENNYDSLRVSWGSNFPDTILETQELGTTNWVRVSEPGTKGVATTSTNDYLGNTYSFQVNVPFNQSGALFRLVPGGLSELNGEGIFSPVTRRY